MMRSVQLQETVKIDQLTVSFRIRNSFRIPTEKKLLEVEKTKKFRDQKRDKRGERSRKKWRRKKLGKVPLTAKQLYL